MNERSEFTMKHSVNHDSSALGAKRARMSRESLLSDAVEHFAKNGIGDASLRSIATSIGTSHRMLIYHFGSREGLLAEVVRTVEQQQRDLLADADGRPTCRWPSRLSSSGDASPRRR